MTYVPFKNATEEAVALLGLQVDTYLAEGKRFAEAGESQLANNVRAVAEEINHAIYYLLSEEHGKLNG